MAFNFPSSPSNGDNYTANGFTYQYDGSKWIRKSPSTGAQGSTGPTGAQGATAAAGAQGATGSGGSTGAQGAAGSNGGTDIVNDTSPQLGGDLDTNSYEIFLDAGHSLKLATNQGQIYHSGSQMYIGTNDLRITNYAVNETMAKFVADGAVELYHNDTKTFETTSSGIDVTGRVTTDELSVVKASGNLSANFEAQNGLGTLEIGGSTGAFIDLKTPFSDDFDLRIDSSGTLTSGGNILLNVNGSESGVRILQNDSVELYYDNVSKAKTASHGMYFNEAYQHQYVNSGNTIELRFTTAGVRRGSVYADNGNTVGFLTPSGGWSARWHSNGKQTTHGDIWPNANNTYDLGDNSYRWANIWVNDLQLSNEAKKDTGGNDVDGTWGDWTLQEGEDKIYMINNRNGKKYSLKMEEE